MSGTQSSDPNAERKKELEALISSYTSTRNVLDGYRENIVNKQESIADNSFTPVCDYDLSGGEEEWIGKNYNTGVEMKNDIITCMGEFDYDTNSVVGGISTAIERLDEKIGELQAELASL